jgi:hypothetical protein
MRDSDAQRLLFHGAVLLLIGLLTGVPYGEAITEGWGPESERAWRVAHTGMTAGGVTLIAIAGALRHVRLGDGAAAWLVWSLVATAYGAVVGLGLGPILGVRGLEPVGPPANVLVFLANAVLAMGALVATVLLVKGTWSTWDARDARPERGRPPAA